MSGNLLRAWQPGFSDIQTKYDLGTKTASTIFSFAGQTKTLTSTTGTDGLEGSTTLISGVNKSAQFDSLNRETVTTIGNLNKLTAYLDVSGNRTTNIPSSVTCKNGDTTLLASSYTYDDNGNIATMTVGNTTYPYTYDANNQLKSVIDGTITASYNYDNGGNLTSKTVNGATISYGYDNTWKDKLISYNGQTITYDVIGNPLSYRDGLTFMWTGRQLNSVAANGVTSSYLYNVDGIRTRKTVGSTTTEYFLNNSQILGEQTGSTVIWYIYDSKGDVLGLLYNGTPYYYLKNQQGDVISIVDANLNVVNSYTYDAWGKVLSITGSGTIGAINPIRYRGYYYDMETGLYYLQSRYYDPETGRFVNADDTDYLGVNGTPLSYNLFAYCENDPVNCADPTGDVYVNISEIRHAGLWVPFCMIGLGYNFRNGTNYDNVSFRSPNKNHRFLFSRWYTYYQVTYYMGIKTARQWFDFCMKRWGWSIKLSKLLSIATDSGATQLFNAYVNFAANFFSLLASKMPKEMAYIINKIKPYKKNSYTKIQITMSSHLSSYSSHFHVGWIGLETRYAWK